MKKKNLENIMEDFYEEYQENPTGWSFWVSSPPESDDFYEAYILHRDEAFFLKLDSIFTPNPVGVGAKLKIEEDQLEDDLPEFGYRKFGKEEAREFLENLPTPEEYESGKQFKKDLKKSQKEIVQKATDKEPIPFEPVRESDGLAALGPYSSKNPLGYISKRQKEMKKELSKKLERMVNRDYPGYY